MTVKTRNEVQARCLEGTEQEATCNSGNQEVFGEGAKTGGNLKVKTEAKTGGWKSGERQRKKDQFGGRWHFRERAQQAGQQSDEARSAAGRQVALGSFISLYRPTAPQWFKWQQPLSYFKDSL